MPLPKTVTLPTSAALMALWTAGAQAHDGHGLTGGHWHPSDAWGFVGVAIIAAIGFWFSRNRK